MIGTRVLMVRVARRLELLPPGAVYAIAGTLVVTLGVLDYLTGTEFSFFIYYWAPIALVAWFADRRTGLFCMLCGAVWFAANWSFRLEEETLLRAFWETNTRLFSFVIFGETLRSLRRAYLTEKRLARTDFLTGVPNRRAFYEVLERELSKARGRGLPVSLAYLDIDNFKALNDTLGHQTGDEVLSTVGASLAEGIRAGDLVARLGGDEFVVFLPGAGESEARRVLERLGSSLSATAAARGWPVSFSVGLATARSEALQAADLVAAADRLLYGAKASGKGSLRAGTLPEEPVRES